MENIRHDLRCGVIETTDREGRNVTLLRINSNPDAWVYEYTDMPWNGGWQPLIDKRTGELTWLSR